MSVGPGESTIALTKHHGLGNDFLVLLCEALPPAPGDAAIALCDRHTGIGADGLIFGVAEAGTTRFVLHNSDGSRAEVSGNGLRCLGQALMMQAGTDRLDIEVATDAGPRAIAVWATENPAEVLARVDMGTTGAGPAHDHLSIPAELAAGRVATVDVGNPHIVIETADPQGHDMAQVGPLIESAFMPTGINVHLIAASATADRIDMAIWERGAGVTEACGSGACAAAAVASRWGLVGDRVDVAMPGGAATVEIGDSVALIGPSVFVAHVALPSASLERSVHG